MCKVEAWENSKADHQQEQSSRPLGKNTVTTSWFDYTHKKKKKKVFPKSIASVNV